MDIKEFLKKEFGYEGKVPQKCHLCGSEDIYAGHNSATSMGVQCTKCGLKLAIDLDRYYIPLEVLRNRKSHETIVLEMVIQLWNKDISADDLIKEEWVRCSECDEWVSKHSVEKEYGGKCYICEERKKHDNDSD